MNLFSVIFGTLTKNDACHCEPFYKFDNILRARYEVSVQPRSSHNTIPQTVQREQPDSSQPVDANGVAEWYRMRCMRSSWIQLLAPCLCKHLRSPTSGTRRHTSCIFLNSGRVPPTGLDGFWLILTLLSSWVWDALGSLVVCCGILCRPFDH